MNGFQEIFFRRAAARYAGAALAASATLAACLVLGGIFVERPFIPLFFVSMLVAIVAGPGPGAFATLLSAVSGDYFFLRPVGSLGIASNEDIFRISFFLASGLLVSLGVGWYGRRARAALDAEVRRARSLLRQEANETLRQSEERYRLLFETSRDGIVTVDMSGKLQDANPAFQDMLGYTLDELRRLSLRDITPARWHEAEEAILRERILPLADSGEYEKEYIGKDGSVFPVCVRAWPICDSEQNVVGLRAFVRDITERKRAEEALKTADRRKDEFLATLAHELRNPLAPIRNAVYLLKQDGSFSKARDRALIDIAERQVEHLIRLVNELLDFSRISRGKIELKREATDLLLVLRHAIETAQPAILSAGHELQTSLPCAPLMIDGDPVRLAQVFTNLLDNAAKYTEHGGKIEVVAQRRGDEAVVTIRDSGVGVPADMLPEIFDYFTQVDRTLGRSKGGLGIGLALVRTLLQLHGGSVEAQSAGVGCGSAFIVRLPAVAAAASRLSAPALPARASRRVLVIDDEKDVADTFADLLARFGAMTRVAYCSETGLQLVKSFRPEIVLLDLGMPQPDGFETARLIRALPEGRDIALVALSGWGKEQVEARVRATGFDGHLTKPAELKSLNDLLDAFRPAHAPAES